MGRPRKPTVIKIAEGDRRSAGVHKLDEQLAAELQAERGIPDCPSHLRGLARTAYLSWTNDLANMGLDCKPDGIMLEGAAVAYARAVDADTMIAKHGSVLKEVIRKKGKISGVRFRKNPACTVSTQAWAQVKSFASEFGLSPVSRTRLSVEKKDPMAPAEEVEFAKWQARKQEAEATAVSETPN